MKAPRTVSAADLMVAAVERGVRVKEFGAVELGFVDGSPANSQSKDYFVELLTAVKAEIWAARTNPVSCTCIHCTDEGYLEAEHERQRQIERSARQEKLDAKGVKHPNRGHWVYSGNGEGREL